MDGDEIVLWFGTPDERENVLGGQHPRGRDDYCCVGLECQRRDWMSGTDEAFDGLNQ